MTSCINRWYNIPKCYVRLVGDTPIESEGGEESVKVLLLGLKVIGMIISLVSMLWGLGILVMYHTNGTKLALQVIIYSLIAIIAFAISIKSKKITSAITFLIGTIVALAIYIFLIIPVYGPQF